MQSKSNRLTSTEIAILCLIICSKEDPFMGNGRKLIMNELDYSSSAYSVNLARLVLKGVLKKSNGKYSLPKTMVSIKKYIDKVNPSEMVMQFTFKFNEE